MYLILDSMFLLLDPAFLLLNPVFLLLDPVFLLLDPVFLLLDPVFLLLNPNQSIFLMELVCHNCLFCVHSIFIKCIFALKHTSCFYLSYSTKSRELRSTPTTTPPGFGTTVKLTGDHHTFGLVHWSGKPREVSVFGNTL